MSDAENLRPINSTLERRKAPPLDESAQATLLEAQVLATQDGFGIVLKEHVRAVIVKKEIGKNPAPSKFEPETEEYLELQRIDAKLKALQKEARTRRNGSQPLFHPEVLNLVAKAGIVARRKGSESISHESVKSVIPDLPEPQKVTKRLRK